MRDYLVDVHGLVKDPDTRVWCKGLMGSYMCEHETEAYLICERALRQPRVERVEIRKYNPLEGVYIFTDVSYADKFRRARNLPRPDLFFRRVKGFQTKIDGTGVFNHENK